MFRAILLAVLMAAAVPGLAAKTALDLMLEGRYTEAKAVLDATGASPRYQILYYALTEPDAARACSLYQVVVIRYPGSDCDSVARGRLDQAHGMGMVIVPVGEWNQAPVTVRPLAMWTKPPVVAAPPAPVAVVSPQTPVSEPKPTAAPASENVVTDVVVSPVEAPKLPAVEAPPKPVVDVVATSKAEPAATKEDVPTPVKPSPPAPSAEPKVELVKQPSPPSKPVPIEATPVGKDVVRDTVTATRVAEKPQKEMISTTRTPELAAPKAAPTVEAKGKAAENAPPKPRVAPLPPSDKPHDRPASTGSWFVQVGAFGNADNAHRLQKSLEEAGYTVKLVPRETSKGTLLQVRVGGYASRDECTPVAEQLKEKFDVPTVIISE